jgi:hypothetical protein
VWFQDWRRSANEYIRKSDESGCTLFEVQSQPISSIPSGNPRGLQNGIEGREKCGGEARGLSPAY